MTTVFDNIPRDDTGPGNYSEPIFKYLNRSAREDVANVRGLIEQWFSHLPVENRSELRARLRSEEFDSAFFELFLHELFLRLDCEMHIHPPSVGGKRTRPDFLVTDPTGDKFYAEAVLATDEPRSEKSIKARIDDLNDSLNRMNSPNFFIGHKLYGIPIKPFRAASIRARVEKELARLDPDLLAESLAAGGFDALPRWKFEAEGCTLEIFPIPKSVKARGKEGIRPVGVLMESPKMVDPRKAILRVIVSKGRRYGEVDLPFIVAVNALGKHVDDTDVMEALFGKEAFTYARGPHGPIGPKPSRIPDGAWVSKAGPRYRRISAVLTAAQLYPWSVTRASVRLYHNPWAAKPYKGSLCRLNQAVPNPEGRMEHVDGSELGGILNLPANWPSSPPDE